MEITVDVPDYIPRQPIFTVHTAVGDRNTSNPILLKAEDWRKPITVTLTKYVIQ